jgi:hypothetical protein
MKTISKIIFSAAVLFCIGANVHAQPRPLISDYEEVVKTAKTGIDSSLQSGYLHEMAVKHKIKGEYVMNVTIFDKGKVLSVFVVKSDSENIKQQNLVKDIVKGLEFNFKVPRGKNYKFEHTFKFE